MNSISVNDVLDDELYNLKRAYNVTLESQERTNFSGNENIFSTIYTKDNAEEDHEEEEEEAWVDGLIPVELCESMINEDDEMSSQSMSEYKCPHCDFVGIVEQLRNHIMLCHPEEQQCRSNWCVQCRINFENKSVLKCHQQQEHMFSCSSCRKSFKRRRLLLAHLPVHSEEKRFKCPTCEKVFPAHRYFVRHLERHEKKLERIHIEDKIFNCSVCHKDFFKKESLVKHMRIHSRESLKCSQCDFTCGKKVTLKMHVLCHEGVRKYKCNQCDFSFKQIGHLKRHIARFNH